MIIVKVPLTLSNIRIGQLIQMSEEESLHSNPIVAGQQGEIESFWYWDGTANDETIDEDDVWSEFKKTFNKTDNFNNWITQVLGFQSEIEDLKYTGIVPTGFDWERIIKNGLFWVYFPDLEDQNGEQGLYYLAHSAEPMFILKSIVPPPSWNPYTTRTIKRNYVPPSSGPAGMRLYLNNNRYSTTGAAKGSVGLSAAASRAINRNNGNFKINYNN
jgi:hypothetical protein